MPDMPASPAGAPGTPAPSSPAGATGTNPASTPSPNRGLEAAALAKLAVYVQGMSVLLAVMPAGSDMARDVREAINKVAKHVPPGAISQGIQMTEAQKNLMQQQQQAPQIAAMRASQMGGGQPGMGGGGAPPGMGGAPPGPPQPGMGA